MIEVFLDGRVYDVFSFEVVIQLLKNHLSLRGCYIGRKNVFSDEDAKLVDMHAPGAAKAIQHLCNDIVFANPRLALVRTALGTEIWVSTLTQHNMDFPELQIKQVRQRNGAPWAKPVLLPAIM